MVTSRYFRTTGAWEGHEEQEVTGFVSFLLGDFHPYVWMYFGIERNTR